MIGIKTVSNIGEMKKYIQNGGTKSVSRAMNDALNKGRTALSKGVREQYTIKAGDFKENSRVSKATPTNLKKGRIEVESRRLTVGTSTHFRITPKQYSSQKGKKVSRRSKASLTVKKGSKKQMKHAFVVNPASINGGNTMLWQREGENIKPITSLSVPQMVTDQKVYNAASKVMETTYQERLKHYMERELELKK